MTETDAVLAVLAELGRAKEKHPAFVNALSGTDELLRQAYHAEHHTVEMRFNGASREGLDRELCQIAAVAIRMLAGV